VGKLARIAGQGTAKVVAIHYFTSAS